MTNGFYKLTENSSLNYAPNAVYNSNYTLLKENKDTYQYPVDGWSWYEDRSDAVSALEPYPSNPKVFSGPKKRGKSVIDKSSFLAKFNATELQSISDAKSTNPILNQYWDIIEKAEWVDMSNDFIRDLLILLVKWNIILPERKDEILK